MMIWVTLWKYITWLTKVRLVKAMVFPIAFYGCESWTIKNAEHQIIDAFELWCWKRLLRVPWTVRRSNQSILKEISLEYSLEGLMAEAPILWPPDVKNWLIRKDPDAGKDWRQEKRHDRGWNGWMASLTQWMWVWASSRSWWWTGKPGVPQSMGLQRVRHDWATEPRLMERQGLPWWLSGKEYTCQCRRHRFNPWLGRFPGEGNGNPFQCSCLWNPMDIGAW